jgi:hypothetical protein
MPCNASYTRFIFGRFLICTTNWYAFYMHYYVDKILLLWKVGVTHLKVRSGGAERPDAAGLGGGATGVGQSGVEERADKRGPCVCEGRERRRRERKAWIEEENVFWKISQRHARAERLRGQVGWVVWAGWQAKAEGVGGLAGLEKKRKRKSIKIDF